MPPYGTPIPEQNIPAAVAFCVNSRTCAWRSSICFCASVISLVLDGRPIPQFGQAEWACDMVRVIVVDMEGSWRVVVMRVYR